MANFATITTDDAEGNFGNELIQNFTDEAKRTKIGIRRASPTSIEIAYNLFDGRQIIDGFIILMSDKPFDLTTRPDDGQRYIGSINFIAPVSTIGHAKVVYSRYAIFGDTVDDNGTFIVTNVDANSVYYVGIFPSTNVLNYYTMGVLSYPVTTEELKCAPPIFTGSIPTECEPPLNPQIGQVYYDINTNIVSMWTGVAWIPAGSGTVKTGIASERPTITSVPPLAQGDFFYNLDTKDLEIWTSTAWVKANTKDDGIPMYEKVGIGTDGSYDERILLADVLRKQLGYPALCIELTEDQFNIAIDNAIEEFRRRCDNAYENQFILFKLKKFQQMYYLNDPILKTDRIVEIIKIHRINLFNLTSMGSSIDAAMIAQNLIGQFYNNNVQMDILSIHLIHALGEDFERIFAGNLMYKWNENKRELYILRNLMSDETVILEVMAERVEQELLRDRYAKQWLQAWAESELMIMLGNIRSKYATLPGPSGGITLNGAELLSQAETMQTELLRQITDYEVGNGGVNFGNCQIFIG